MPNRNGQIRMVPASWTFQLNYLRQNPRWIGSTILLIALLIAIPAFAGLHDIHPEKLPQTPEVQKAYADLVKLEPMVETWSPTWRYETPKADVAALLKTSQGRLQEALAATPDNEELLLIYGLVAHYALGRVIFSQDAGS